jgi:hypothetical protein
LIVYFSGYCTKRVSKVLLKAFLERNPTLSAKKAL